MMVQPRTLFIGMFTVAALLIGGVVYMFVKPSSGDKNDEMSSLPAVVTDAQIIKTSLQEYAEVANLVRAAYDQKKNAAEDDNDDPKIICGDFLVDVDLALVSQTLSIDIDEKIKEIVNEKQVAANQWSDCASTCTCGTLMNLYEENMAAGGPELDGSALNAAMVGAQDLTTSEALRCAEANINLCQLPLLRKYVDQASTIE
jgi:gas vesicle protein